MLVVDVAYSQAALGLQQVAASRLPRFDKRLSFLSLDHARVVQGRTGVIALLEDGTEVGVPGGSLVVLMLGPGTSITTPALRSLANSGCIVMASTATGDGCFTTAVPLGSTGKWACAQASLWSSDSARLGAARFLYQKRFPEPLPDGLTISQLRGLEGTRMKALYKQFSASAGLSSWRRRVEDAEGSVNSCLNLANSILYGVAASACSAFVLSPALGIIHQGASNAFLFDLADCFKAKVAVPAAFGARRRPDPAAHTRRAVRDAIRRERVLAGMVEIITQMLEPYLPNTGDLDVLYGEAQEWVPGHKNYFADADGEALATGAPDDGDS